MNVNDDGYGVAIVDDETDVIRTYELLFKKRQIPISFIAYDGDEALEKFKKANPKPKIAIIDYRLPTMSGLDLMKKVLTIEPRIRIVFISGDLSVKQRSLNAGATVFMKKPTGIKEITDTVTSLMDS